MGITFIKGTVSHKGRKQTLRFFLDSGAAFTLLPDETWKALDLKAKRTETFELADGTPVERRVSECHIKLPKFGDGHTPVILGEPGDEALLGVVTL